MGQADVEVEVYFADTRRGIARAVGEVFGHFGGAGRLLKASKDVYVKVNGVDRKPYSFTDPEVLRAVIRCFQTSGARDIYVIENSTQGNLTRLVFEATGIARVCRQTGAIPVHLDETEAVPVWLEGIEAFVDLSAFVHERLVERCDDNLYVSLPKLKTHSMSQVTLSVKNQFGLVHQASRIADHNYKLHQKFADIYRVLRPDFVVVDGVVATNHGHYVAERYAAECVVPTGCLIGGRDPLAVDVVGAAFLGFGLGDVEHLARAAQTGIGVGDLDRIEIGGRDLFEQRRRDLTCELLDRFPADVTILRGRTRCCREGCRRNTETVVEVLAADHRGRGGFTILMGKDIDPQAVARVRGPVHLAGGCAIQDYGRQIARRPGRHRVTSSPGCNSLVDTVMGLCKHMGVHPLRLAGMNPLKALRLLAEARLNRSKALIPPLFR